jgi:hypothetical protein
MSLHRNRVQMTVTGTPGTGTITLNAATSGYQSFGTAYGADATVDILIVEGNNWEVCRNCLYTHATPSVDRGTREASSAAGGGAVSFGTGAIVSVIATAATGNNWGLNEAQSNADAAVTGVVGTMHILDIGPFTADRDFTLPATCAVGDRVGVFLKTGDDAFALLLKPNTGDTINGGSAGAEWSRLFISNECVIFRCITANADWIVEYDGRIPQMARMSRITTDQTTGPNPANAWTTTDINSADIQRGATVDVANNYILWRRQSYVLISGGWQAQSGKVVADNSQMGWACSTAAAAGGTVLFNFAANHPGTTSRPWIPTAGLSAQVVSPGTTLYHSFFSQTTTDVGARGLTNSTFLQCLEVFE